MERYDAVAQAVLKVAPEMKFVGLALSAPSDNAGTFEYFLDPKNHKPGVPLDYISFHVYATPTADQTVEDWQYTFFDTASEFLAVTYPFLTFTESPSFTLSIFSSQRVM